MDTKDKDFKGISVGGIIDAVRQMDGLNKSVQKNNTTEETSQGFLTKNLKIQKMNESNDTGILIGGIREAVRQMDEITRLINKKSKI